MDIVTIIARDLSKQPPSSPRDRLLGFVIAKRAIDKCRSNIAGMLGEYHYDSPLDNLLFSFKAVTAEKFKIAVQNSENYEDVGAWLMANGELKSSDEIMTWSAQMESFTLMNDPVNRAAFIENCTKLGLNPYQATLFELLEADDRASFAARVV